MSNYMSIQDGAVKREMARAMGETLLKRNGYEILQGCFDWSELHSFIVARDPEDGALVLADQDRILSKAWELGDCNNQFVLMIVSKEGELVFLRKGVLSEQDKADFYETIEKYK